MVRRLLSASIGMVFISVLLALSAVLLVHFVTRQEQEVLQLYTTASEQAVSAERLLAESEHIERLIHTYVLAPDERLLEELEASRERFDNLLPRVVDSEDSPEERELVEAVVRAKERTRSLARVLVERRQEGVPLETLQQRHGEEHQSARTALDASVLRLVEGQRETLRAATHEANRQVTTLVRLYFWSVPGALGALVLLGGLTLREVRRRGEEQRAAERNAAELEGILSIAADAILSIDEKERILLFNQTAERIFGYSKGEVIGQPFDRLFPERMRRVHLQRVRDFISAPHGTQRLGVFSSGFFGLKKTGDTFPVELALSKLEVGDSRLVTLVLRDITEQVRQEKEERFLAELGTLLASTLECEQILSCLTGLVVCSLADYCIVDLVEQEGLARRVALAHCDPDKADLAKALERMMSEPRGPHLVPSVLETKLPRLVSELPSGYLESLTGSEEDLQLLRELQPRSLVGLPLLAQGRLLGTLTLVSSHPLRRYGEKDLRLGEELAYRASLALQSARLYQLAQEATRARDDVLGVVAHDLRSPLNAISLSAQMLLRQQEGDARLQAPLRSIRGSVQRMNRLIQDLLNVVRMEAGQLAVETHPEPAGALLQEAFEAARPLASEVELCLEAPAELPRVRADRERLLQVFSNLLGNALKFTPPGGRVTLGANVEGALVRFWVRDTGPGIPPEALEHLFDRFWQVRRGDRRGAGLGLSIAKGLVEAQAGRIWVESEPGHGSTFFFTVPVALEEPVLAPSGSEGAWKKARG